jgi:DNA mismatch repair protein MLH1
MRSNVAQPLLGILAVSRKKKVASQHKVRTSTHNRTLDSMFAVASTSQTAPTLSKTRSKGAGEQADHDVLDVDAEQPPPTMPTPTATVHKRHEIKETECWLTSVANLRKAIQEDRHNCASR